VCLCNGVVKGRKSEQEGEGEGERGRESESKREILIKGN
jgi:hypothetical protein